MVAVASVAAAATTTTTTTTTSSSYGCYNNITPPRWKSGNGNYCSSSPISVVSMTKTPKLLLHASSSSFNNPLLLCRYGALPSTFVGFKHLGISVQFRSGRGAACRGVRCKRGRTIQASLFGVGAPEALVIGVVALLVFGPKGLAEVARNLGKTLRAFQPTIRELQEVSRDFKSTLEREIGLDEVQSSLQSTYRPPNTSVNEKPLSAIDQNGAQPYKAPYSSEDLLKVTEQQLATSSATQAQGTNSEEKPQVVETTATENSASNAVPESSQTSSIPPSLEAVPPAAAPATDSLTSTTQSPSSVEKSQNEQ